MRRQHIAPGRRLWVDVIDFTRSGTPGTYGKMKVRHEYMDDERQNASRRYGRFLIVCPSTTARLPWCAALARRIAAKRPCALPVDGSRAPDDNGNNAKTLILRYLLKPGGLPPAAATAAAGSRCVGSAARQTH